MRASTATSRRASRYRRRSPGARAPTCTRSRRAAGRGDHDPQASPGRDMTAVRSLPSPGDGAPERIVEAIRERTAAEPVAGVVLGSGLSDAVEAVRSASDGEGVEISYADLPGFPPPTVVGHAGRLWIGRVGQRALAVFQGRIHFYEGHGMAMASITSRLSAELGARAMVLTAATGALDPSIQAGTLVGLRDHLNLMGVNPLSGWRFPGGSPAFVDVSQVYDSELADLALTSARAHADGSGRAVTDG